MPGSEKRLNEISTTQSTCKGAPTFKGHRRLEETDVGEKEKVLKGWVNKLGMLKEWVKNNLQTGVLGSDPESSLRERKMGDENLARFEASNRDKAG